MVHCNSTIFKNLWLTCIHVFPQYFVCIFIGIPYPVHSSNEVDNCQREILSLGLKTLFRTTKEMFSFVGADEITRKHYISRCFATSPWPFTVREALSASIFAWGKMGRISLILRKDGLYSSPQSRTQWASSTTIRQVFEEYTRETKLSYMVFFFNHMFRVSVNVCVITRF